MIRRFIFPACLALLLTASPSFAVIKVLTPLKKVLEDCDAIFAAEVDKVDPEKPSVTFKFTENLKGKAPAEKFPVNLTGDSFAKKDDHTKIMLDRLEPGRKLIVFTIKGEKSHTAFGYLEGTWFQMKGTVDGDAIRWAFLHCEPYFRRTFKGTTEELKTAVVDGLSGKKAPPEPDEKEPHGFGPPVEKKKNCDPLTPDPSPQGERGVCGPLFGVIPSFVLVGPLAILAALFPSVFAGLSTGLSRWRAFLVTISWNSLFTTAIFILGSYSLLPNHWLLGTTSVLATVMVFTLAGIAWAGVRYRLAAEADPSITAPPGRNDLLALVIFFGVMVAALAVIAYFFDFKQLLWPPGREFTAIAAGLFAGIVYTLFRMATRNVGSSQPMRVSSPGELAALLGVLGFTLVMLVDGIPRQKNPGVVVLYADREAIDAVLDSPITVDDAQLLSENPDNTLALSSVAVAPSKLFLGTSRITAFATKGYLLCFDRATGKKVWEYTDDDMKAVFSTPTVIGNKLYVGEGLHTDADCRLFCIDTETGQPIWTFKTASHTEGTPAVVDGKVYFSAGDDGLYCLDAEKGKEIWHFTDAEQKLHIDTSVVVANGKVYGGSGYNTFAAFCLDATTGKPIWQKKLPHRSFGTPLLIGKQLFLGVGTGNLSEDLSTEKEANQTKETNPAGMLLAFDAATGNELWAREFSHSVHTQLATNSRVIYAGCRDGWLYAFDRKTGKQLWKFSYSGPLTSGPVVAERDGFPIAVYCCSDDGMVYCHSPFNGKVIWSRSIREMTNREANIPSSPTLVIKPGSLERELFVPVTIKKKNGQDAAAIARFVDKLAE